MNNTNLHPTIDGQTVTIRSIRLTDADMEAEFVRQLSPQSTHYQFLGGMSELSAQDVDRFVDVDGRHSIAFVATVNEDGQETEVGVGRFAPNTKDNVRDMAVTVVDEWQREGLGTLLTQQLIDFAKGYGIKQLYSLGLADNRAMRELANDLGMTIKRDPNNAHQMIYSLKL